MRSHGPVPIREASRGVLVLTAPHCGTDWAAKVVHGIAADGIRDAPDYCSAACGADVHPIPIVWPGAETTWPWPPAVTDCRRLGLTRCPVCADQLGTRGVWRLTTKEAS